MRLGGRLAAAIEILDDIETRHRPVSEALKDWGVSHRFAGSGDRAAIGNIVYDTLRWRSSMAWVMGEGTPRAIVLGMVARHWQLTAEHIARAVEDDPHGPPPLSPNETERLSSVDLVDAPGHIRADVPEWLAPKFERAFGPEWVEEGAALALRPSLDMRVNRLRADRPKVLKTLAKFGATETPFSPDGLRIAPTAGDHRHPNVQIEPAFQKGWFEIHDEGSQLAAQMVGARPGEQLLDLCAGAGGKTLALSAAMANKGQIIATDRDRARLAPIFDRLKRAGTRNVQVREAGAPLDDLEGRMDAVLIDAPCTGTGVWRRRPDAKWRLTERALADRLSEQTALLASSARYLKPGGRLVYVTCSLLPEENEDRISAFLSAEPAFRLSPPEEIWNAATAAPLPEDTVAPVGAARAIRITPHRHATDGFFIAVLQRASGEAKTEP